MEITAPKTKTNQILDFLLEKIESGALRPGDKLDSMRTLSAKFQVSTTTIRLVFDELERRHLIRSEKSGRDVFITDPQESALRFLIVMHEQRQESPAQYIVPEFSTICRMANANIDTIMLEFLRNTPEAEMLQKLKTQNYSGILLMGTNFNGDEPELSLLHKLNVPVLIGHTNNQDDTRITGFASLYLDESRAWEMAKEFLHSQGCRKIGSVNYGDYSRGSMEGIESHFPFQLDGTFEQSMSDWFRSAGEFDALLCFSDFFALRVYDWCRKNHVRIPEDLKVMGICGYPGGSLLEPPLSTVDFRYQEFGRIAAETLLRGAKNGLKAEPIEISPLLQARESTENTKEKEAV